MDFLSLLLGFAAGAGLIVWSRRNEKVVHPEYLDILAKQTYEEYPPPTNVPDLIVKDAASRLNLYRLAER